MRTDSLVFSCGDKHMERDVLATLAELVPRFGERLDTLKRDGRFHVETY